MKKLQLHFIHGVAGSGKTSVLKTRINDYLKKYAPDEIMAVSFTKNAAENLARDYGVQAKTLHSLGYQLGGFNGKSILSDGELNFLLGGFASTLRFQRNKNLPLSVIYSNILTAMKSYTFEDLLDFYPTNINFKVLIVDEAQDLTPLMHLFLARLASSGELEQMVFAGDQMQSIFNFLGSESDFQTAILQVFKDKNIFFDYFSRKLQTSYRLSKSIAAVASQFTSFEIKVPEEAPVGTANFYAGTALFGPEFVDMHGKGTVAILCRTNSQCDKYSHMFSGYGFEVNSKLMDSIFTMNPRFRAYFKLVRYNLYKEDFDLDSVMPYVKEKYKTTPKDKLHASMVPVPFEMTDQLFLLASKPKRKSISILTVHAAKGLEWDTVFWIDDWGKQIFVVSALEAQQLGYVAVTRAKERIYIFQKNARWS